MAFVNDGGGNGAGARFWIPAFAGMTAAAQRRRQRSSMTTVVVTAD